MTNEPREPAGTPTDPLTGSTGSKGADTDTTRHRVVLEDGRDVAMPGSTPLQQIWINGRAYVHVSDDATGRWIYRPL